MDVISFKLFSHSGILYNGYKNVKNKLSEIYRGYMKTANIYLVCETVKVQ